MSLSIGKIEGVAGLVLIGSIGLLAYIYRDKLKAAGTAVANAAAGAAKAVDSTVDAVAGAAAKATNAVVSPGTVQAVGGADSDKILAYFGTDTVRYQAARQRAIAAYLTSNPTADQIIGMDNKLSPSEVVKMSSADLLSYAGGDQAMADALLGSAQAATLGQNYDISKYSLDENGTVISPSNNSGVLQTASSAVKTAADATPWWTALFLPQIAVVKGVSSFL